MKVCKTCKKELSQQGKMETIDCEGVCLECTAKAGDSYCAHAMEKIREHRGKS